MKKLIAAAAAALSLSTPAMAEDKDSLVTILTAAEPQTQLMAMVLSMQAAQKGVAPHILLCGPAADLALKEAPESATTAQPPKGMSPQGLMQKIMAQPGAKVEVCAIYLPGKGAGAEVLLDGVTPANPLAMADALLSAETLMSF